MLGDKQKKQQDIDALDTLRRWIKKSSFEFGSLKPVLIVQEGQVVRVEIKQGDMTISLKVDAPFS